MVISGQSKRKQTIYNSGLKGMRQFGVQEVNILPIIDSITKYSCMINEPNKVKYHLEKATYLAKTGRPGPVWIDVPLDVQGALIKPESLESFEPEKEGFELEDKKNIKPQVEEIFNFLKNSKRPLIIAGNGVRLSKSVEKFNELIKSLNIPVVTPRLGIDIIGSNSEFYIGRPGIKGDRPANLAIQNADLLLCIGTRLSVNVTGHEFDKFAPRAKIIVIDIDEVEHKKNTIKIDNFFKQDASNFINTLYGLVKQEDFSFESKWLNKCLEWKTKYPVVLPSYKDEKIVNTYYFTEILSKYMNHNDVIVIDSGSSSYVVSQSIKIKKGQRYIASGGLGSMGYALPTSIGASVARGKKRVICITGDGSFHFNIQELQTLVHSKLPIKIFVYNNNGYSSIYSTQKRIFKDHFVGSDKDSGVSIPDILRIAELYGVKGVRINYSDEIETKIKEVLDFNGPVICDVICDRDQLIIPTVYSVKNKDGKMISKPLEDMYPFLSKAELKKEMISEYEEW